MVGWVRVGTTSFSHEGAEEESMVMEVRMVVVVVAVVLPGKVAVFGSVCGSTRLIICSHGR